MQQLISKNKNINIELLFILAYIFGLMIFGVGTRSMELVRLSLICAAVIYILMTGRVKVNMFLLWMLFYVLYVCLSSTWSGYGYYAVVGRKTVMMTFIVFFSFFQLAEKRSDWLMPTFKLFATLPILGFLLFVLENGSGALFDMRAVSNDQMYNFIGQNAGNAIAFCLICFIREKNKTVKRFFWIPVMLINLYIVYVSGSRKSLLYMMVPVLFLIVFASNKRKRILRNLSIVVCILIIGYLALRYTNLANTKIGVIFNNLYGAVFEDGYDVSATGRIEMIEYSFDMFKENPIFGKGIGTIEGVMRVNLDQEHPITDCDYTSILVDLGMVGLVLFYSMHAILLLKIIKYFKYFNLEHIILAGFLIMLIINGFICRMYFNNNRIFIYLFIIWTEVENVKKVRV